MNSREFFTYFQLWLTMHISRQLGVFENHLRVWPPPPSSWQGLVRAPSLVDQLFPHRLRLREISCLEQAIRPGDNTCACKTAAFWCFVATCGNSNFLFLGGRDWGAVKWKNEKHCQKLWQESTALIAFIVWKFLTMSFSLLKSDVQQPGRDTWNMIHHLHQILES